MIFICRRVSVSNIEVERPMWSPYKKRLLGDLDRWESNGWVSSEGRSHIVAELEAAASKFNLASALGILASVLFGFAALSFVAAHWEDVPRLARLTLLLLSLCAGYGAAGWLETRGHSYLADAAILFSAGMFGGSIMLISQMYHIAGELTDGMLLWWVGTLFAGVLLRSNPALAFALVLVCVWSFMRSSMTTEVHWPFLIGWGLVTIAFAWQRWWPGLHLSALALTFFIISLGYLLGGRHSQEAVALLGVCGAVGCFASEKLRPEFDRFARPLFVYASAVAFAGLFALQFFEVTSKGELIINAVITLALLIGAIAHALSVQNTAALWLGYLAFSVEILAVYGVTVGTILGTSLFFLITAIIVAALAYAALRLARRSTNGGLIA
jgi:uncharacterized membrane protein